MLGATGGAFSMSFAANIPGVASGEVGADQALISSAQNAATAAAGTAVGAAASKVLTSMPGFGGLGNLSNGGAALGAGLGEAGGALGNAGVSEFLGEDIEFENDFTDTSGNGDG